jgi:selenocysteine lyase/cysteine desulfurase
MMVVMFLDRALEILLGIGADRIENHARDLSERVSAGLEKLGYTVISPNCRAGRSGNTCFLAEDAKGVQDRLSDRGVLCWGEYGRVRVSTHLYNGSKDVDRLLKALAEIDRS